MNRYTVFLMVFVAVVVINIVGADIYCNDQGYCSGDGRPNEDVRCGSEYFCFAIYIAVE